MQRRTVLGAGFASLFAASLSVRRMNITREDVMLREAVHRIDAARRKAELPSLVGEPALADTARRHSMHMQLTRLATHDGAKGEDPSVRARQAGYAGRLLGEALAETHDGPAETVSVWLAHASTRAVVLDPEGLEFGIGAFRGHDGRVWWDLVVGRPV